MEYVLANFTGRTLRDKQTGLVLKPDYPVLVNDNPSSNLIRMLREDVVAVIPPKLVIPWRHNALRFAWLVVHDKNDTQDEGIFHSFDDNIEKWLRTRSAKGTRPPIELLSISAARVELVERLYSMSTGWPMVYFHPILRWVTATVAEEYLLRYKTDVTLMNKLFIAASKELVRIAQGTQSPPLG